MDKVLERFEGLHHFFNMSRYDGEEVRTVFEPDGAGISSDKMYLKSSTGERYTGLGEEDSANLYDPRIPEILEEATSGFMSHHILPKEEFFTIREATVEAPATGGVNPVKSNLKFLSKEIHKRVQHPHNILEVAKSIYYRLLDPYIFFTCDKDEVLGSKLKTYQASEGGYASSTGHSVDIMYVMEKISKYNIKTRFIKPPLVNDKFKEEVSGKEDCYPWDKADTKIYRVCLPVALVKETLLKEDDKLQDKDKERLFTLRSGLGDKFVDIWYSQEYGLLEMSPTDIRTIAFSHSRLMDSKEMRVKGSIAKRALPQARLVHELNDYMLSAVQKNYGGGWRMSEHVLSREQVMERDGIVISDSEVQDLSRRLDIGGLKQLIVTEKMALGDTFFLNIFKLIEKSRMTTEEVSIRRADSFKGLALWVALDRASFLEPLVLSMAAHVLEDIDPLRDNLEGRVLSVDYISPVAQAINNSRQEEFQRTLGVVNGAVSLDPKAIFTVNVPKMLRNLFEANDKLEDLRPTQEEQALIQRQERQQQEAHAAQVARKQGAQGGVQQPPEQGADDGQQTPVPDETP